MTRSIEDELNLPRLEDALKELGQQVPDYSEHVDPDLDEISQALINPIDASPDALDPLELGTHAHDGEMDEVYKQAMKVHADLVDLGFNIEAKHAGSIMGPAASFLELAFKASNSKNDSRHKAAKLRMDREKLDHDLRKHQTNGVIQSETTDPTAGTSGSILADRNDLMKAMRNKAK